MAKIRNVRTGRLLASRLTIARGFWQKAKGLLGQPQLAWGTGLYLAPCNSIHSFFMQFPFDAVFVDAEWQTVYLIHGMSPFRISPLVFRSHGVLELPAGTIRATDTQVGDTLELLLGRK